MSQPSPNTEAFAGKSEARVGVDLGGTLIKAGYVQGRKILKSCSVDTPAGSSPEVVLDAVAEAVRQLDVPVDSIGFAIPGEVRPSGECWMLPNVPGFEGVNIRAELSARLSCPVVVENDGTTAALAEALFGHGLDHPSFLMVTLGTGVGGGVVLDGKVRRGSHGFAGEVGHILIDRSPNAPKDGANLGGTIEAYAGTRALLAHFHGLGGSGDQVLSIAESARRGDAAGVETFRMMAEALADGITNAQNLLDLDAIVFTGGISRSFDLIEPALRAALVARRYAEPLGAVPLLVSELGDSAGLVGAAQLVRQFGES